MQSIASGREQGDNIFDRNNVRTIEINTFQKEFTMKKEKRFIKTYSQLGFGTGVEILVDKETGVNYLYCSSGYGGGLTVLLDRDGKPVITTVERD